MRSAVSFVLVLLLLIPKGAQAQDAGAILTGGAVVADATNIIQQLSNLGATLGGDFAIVTGGTAGQLSALLAQFKAALGTDVTVPLNTLGQDIQQLAARIEASVNQLNSILSLQRNCGVANAQEVISGIKNVGLNLAHTIPILHTGLPELSYIQFTGHDPEIIPGSGGEFTLYGFDLYSSYAPVIELDSADGKIVETLSPKRGGSADQVLLTLDAATVTNHAGETLNLNIDARTPKKFLFFTIGKRHTALNLPISFPIQESVEYAMTAKVVYSCSVPQTVNLPEQDFDFHNDSCEDRKDESDTRTPTLPVDATFSNVAVSGEHYINWDGAHQSPNTRNQSSIGVSYTTTTVTAAGWLDTASCTNFIAGKKLDHDTFWQARVVPEVSYVLAQQHIEPTTTIQVQAQDGTTSGNLSFNTSCGETGVKIFSYSVTPIVKGQAQAPIYVSPDIQGNQDGVSDKQVLNTFIIDANWNPVPVAGKTQVSIQVAVPACGK
jgi:hypothetical protein